MIGRLIPVHDVNEQVMRSMLKLMHAHYLGVDEYTFVADLNAKDHVLLLEESGSLVGFTSLVVFECTGDKSELIQVVYSGDTVVEKSHWGSPALFKYWMKSLQELGVYGSARKSYWLLLASGARTYRMLPAFWKRCYPHWRTYDRGLRVLADRLASTQFGNRYDTETGVVTFQNAYTVRPELKPTNGSNSNVQVEFYNKRNPGHVAGDELVCITELTPSNLTRLGARMAAEL